MHKILNHKITLIVAAAALLVALGAGVYALLPNHPILDTFTVSKMDVSEGVSATGDIDTAEHVSLSFGKAGTIQSIPVKVGDKVQEGQLLASLDASDLYAALDGANADVAIQTANLSSLSKGSRPEQVAVNQQTVDTANLNLQTTLQSSYLKAFDAVRNQLDTLFTNGGSVNPQYNLITEIIDDKNSIDQSRISAGEAIDSIKSEIDAQAYDTKSLDGALKNLDTIKDFIDKVIAQVDFLNTSNSGLQQSQIDGYTAVANGAASELNGAITAFNGARQALNTATAQLSLVNASGTPDALTAQEAQVTKAEANVASIRSQISHAIIVAPFDGVVASIVPKVGEAIAAGAPVIDFESAGGYVLDVYIPESDVVKVSVGVPATVSIDAYGPSSSVTAHVASVDLSETMINGIGSYKTTLDLDDATTTIVRAGMSATAVIAGGTATNVLAVPTSALIKKADGLYALVKSAGSFVQTKVSTGISGNGFTEITSGLSEGDHVAVFGGQ